MDGEWEEENHAPDRVVHQDRIPGANSFSSPSRSLWPSYPRIHSDSTTHPSQFESLASRRVSPPHPSSFLTS